MILDFSGLITVSQLSKLEGVTRKTVYRWIENKSAPLHVQTPDGRYFFYKDALLAWKRPKKGRRRHEVD